MFLVVASDEPCMEIDKFDAGRQLNNLDFVLKWIQLRQSTTTSDGRSESILVAHYSD